MVQAESGAAGQDESEARAPRICGVCLAAGQQRRQVFSMSS